MEVCVVTCILFFETILFDFLCSAEILPWLMFTLHNAIFRYISDSCIFQSSRHVHNIIEGKFTSDTFFDFC